MMKKIKSFVDNEYMTKSSLLQCASARHINWRTLSHLGEKKMRKTRLSVHVELNANTMTVHFRKCAARKSHKTAGSWVIVLWVFFKQQIMYRWGKDTAKYKSLRHFGVLGQGASGEVTHQNKKCYPTFFIHFCIYVFSPLWVHLVKMQSTVIVKSFPWLSFRFDE